MTSQGLLETNPCVSGTSSCWVGAIPAADRPLSFWCGVGSRAGGRPKCGHSVLVPTAFPRPASLSLRYWKGAQSVSELHFLSKNAFCSVNSGAGEARFKGVFALRNLYHLQRVVLPPGLRQSAPASAPGWLRPPSRPAPVACAFLGRRPSGASLSPALAFGTPESFGIVPLLTSPTLRPQTSSSFEVSRKRPSSNGDW